MFRKIDKISIFLLKFVVKITIFAKKTMILRKIRKFINPKRNYLWHFMNQWIKFAESTLTGDGFYLWLFSEPNFLGKTASTAASSGAVGSGSGSTSGTSSLCCPLCQAILSNDNALRYHMNYVHAMGASNRNLKPPSTF